MTINSGCNITNGADTRNSQARDSHLDLSCLPYVLYGVKYIDLVSCGCNVIARFSQARAAC